MIGHERSFGPHTLRNGTTVGVTAIDKPRKEGCGFQLDSDLRGSPCFVILSLYCPQPAVLDGAWRCPPITRVA